MNKNIKRIDATVAPKSPEGLTDLQSKAESPADEAVGSRTGLNGPLTVGNYLNPAFLESHPVEASMALKLFVDMIKTLSPKDAGGNAIYLFEYEANDFMDLKANRMTRDTSGVHLPELEQSDILRFTRGGGRYRRFYFKPYFFKWGQFGEQVSHGDTPHSIATRDQSIGRQAIRNQIESEIVLPFIDAIEQRASAALEGLEEYYPYFFPYYRTRILYPVPWFTGHEVGIQVTFNFDLPLC